MPELRNELFVPHLNDNDLLYHYTSAGGLKGICDGNFWATHGMFLNDMTEFRAAEEIVKSILTENIPDANLLSAMFDTVTKVHTFLRDEQPASLGGSHYSIYVISFSEEKDSLLLWSEYSDLFGYCLEFTHKQLLDSISLDSDMMVGKVLYNLEEQRKAILRVFDLAFGNETDNLDNYGICSWDALRCSDIDTACAFIEDVAGLSFIVGCFFKNGHLADEKEYRFVVYATHDIEGHHDSANNLKQKFRLREDRLLPYLEVKLSNLDSLRSVIVGPKNNCDVAVAGVRQLLRHKDIHAEVDKSELPLR